MSKSPKQYAIYWYGTKENVGYPLGRRNMCTGPYRDINLAYRSLDGFEPYTNSTLGQITYTLEEV